MNLITLENISKSYSEKILLKNISLGINDGDKIGIIGINGAGKSTLLKIVAGKDEFYEGDLIKNKNARIEYLSQNPDFKEDATVIEQIFRGDTKELKLLMEYEKIIEKLHNTNSDALNDRLLKLQVEIDSLNLWDLESEAKSILNKLGITNYEERMKNLSGGQKKRVALASALITPCDLLILDEPTNHLDSDSIEWLEEYLNSRKGALLMITHDRYFLDRVANRIIELDRGNLYSYEGNYTSFLEKKMERVEREESEEQKRQSLIRKELKWVKRGAKARSTKQRARLQRFDELVSREYIKQATDVEMSFVGTRLGKKIIEINGLNKSFDDRLLIKDFNYIFTKEDRIGVVGPNGAGKSTLINLIRGNIKSDSGEIVIGETVKIGCFAQDDREMDMNMRVIDYVREGGEYIPVADGSKITASTMCERFLFDGTMQYTKIEKLSGGERRRLYLLRVLMEAPNVLLLDEPTNDLDINTLNILEDFLDKFIGVVVVVSHDRYFLDRVCNKIFAYRDKGSIKVYNGNYSDYQITIEVEKGRIEPEDKKDKKAVTSRTKERDNRPKFSFKETKEYEEIPEVIEKLENRISNIEEEMVKNSSSYGKLQELMEEKEKLEEELMGKYERYDYLEDLAKQIEAYKNNK
ncbi:ABC-F family ATP-binding cassette domain-containing protein [Clostridium cibarium]|uniref:ABC-F family ATP-binding cassette domain-containing protein n=1 Tax=Clostridium cibarium TaxID=2762247 RepID=A0ABR8PQT1_9CLOT|nr:ABC-F family ATP-binding cassette domain-containing protein [Clostridium cibarium]MBD7910512.1 ABC-F family ATP-binding cassette domain-containing protein [Clostridium cibarium]